MSAFNINQLNGNKMLLEKQHYDYYSHAPPMVNKYMDLIFSHSLHQLTAGPTRNTERTETFTDHILTNCIEKVIQSGVLEMGSSDHQLKFLDYANYTCVEDVY